MLKVLVADSHPIARVGIKCLLLQLSREVALVEARTPRESLGRFRERSFDVVILDVSVPGEGGLEVIKEMRRENPRVPIVAMSIYSNDEIAIRALRAGASAYLSKDLDLRRMAATVEGILRGATYYTPNAVTGVVPRAPLVSGAPLSDREYQVLCLIATGESLTGISSTLNLSPKTICTYRMRAMSKLNIKNNAEVTRYMAQHLV